ncbi:MAG TPA: fused MFS/spermidine synthase [Thermoanaerobaculia bacterium]|nr:fused MFS/spermidine synthase [Thermoanaerobaculia bacterium]
MKREVVGAAAIVFVASFCLLVIELVAGRILAPYVGVSLYTWTSIIGVVLAGISIGAWVGGALADRYDTRALLPLLLLLSAAAAFLIVPLANAVGSDRFPAPQSSLMLRVVTLAALIFFLPSCILGTISPVAVKMALRDLARTGHVVGRLYAVSTVGSILGTFATGFFLIARFGTRAILVGVAVVLLICAAATLAGARRKIAVLAIVPVFIGCYHFMPSPLASDSKYFTETNYYTIRVEERTRIDGSGKLETLILDQLVHSLNDPLHPCFMAYSYLRTFQDLIQWKADSGAPLHLLFLGGGGYTLPRCIAETLPNADIDVVEIDPGVTKTAYRYLGLRPDERLHSTNADARWFLMRSQKKYDIIFDDAFNDISIPYHLTTREFVQLQKEHLLPGGVLASNVIDNVPRGDFLPSYLRTVQSVFGDRNVTVLAEPDGYARNAQSTLVVVAGNLAFHFPAEDAISVPRRDIDDAFRRGRWTLLTDDYAPVDNLVAPLFAERLHYQRR